MRILLDTNIWRCIIHTGLGNKLLLIISRHNIGICIAPAIVIEPLRMSDKSIRGKTIEFQTPDCWGRLMPDAFLECEDVKWEMMRFHLE